MTGYHGTDRWIDQMKTDPSGSRTDDGFYGPGLYFFPDKDSAVDYGPVIIEAEISCSKPLVLQENSWWGSETVLDMRDRLAALKGVPSHIGTSTTIPDGYHLVESSRFDYQSGMEETLYSVDPKPERYSDPDAIYGPECYTVRSAIAGFNDRMNDISLDAADLSHLLNIADLREQMPTILRQNNYDALIIEDAHSHDIREIVVFDDRQVEVLSQTVVLNGTELPIYSKSVSQAQEQQIVFHGSTQPHVSIDISSGELGFHCGTVDQALDRVGDIERFSITQYRIDTSRTYDMVSDLGDWSDLEMLQEYFHHNEGPLSHIDWDTIQSQHDVRQLLIENGISSISYINSFEAEYTDTIGTRSYVILDPSIITLEEVFQYQREADNPMLIKSWQPQFMETIFTPPFDHVEAKEHFTQILTSGTGDQDLKEALTALSPRFTNSESRGYIQTSDHIASNIKLLLPSIEISQNEMAGLIQRAPPEMAMEI
jgi:hypothetical protein